MEQEVHDGEKAVYAGVQARGGAADQAARLSCAQAAEDLGVHPTQLRDWVKKFADDPQHAFPGHGQMKPEQLEIAQLKREVVKLKAERDILKKAAAYFAKEST
jgi:transposase